jgi:hypothetical protein
MTVISISLFFIAVIVFIIAYGIKSVYDIMEDIDDKQNSNHPKNPNENKCKHK